MTITNTELLEFAKTQDPNARLRIDCSINWLAAQAATQLSGKEHRMMGWKEFDDFSGERTYTKVSPEYAEWAEQKYAFDLDENTYTTFQDAIDELEDLVGKE